MGNKVYRAGDLLEEVYEINRKAKASIVAIMKSNNIKVLDFTLDKEGRSSDDEGYDEEFVLDFNVQVDCDVRRDTGWYNLTKVELTDADRLLLTAQGCYDEIDSDGIFPTTTTWIDILARLQAMF